MNNPNYEGLKTAFASLGEGEKLYYGKSEVRSMSIADFTVMHLSNIGREVYEEIDYSEANMSRFSIKRQLNFVSEPIIGTVFQSNNTRALVLPLEYVVPTRAYRCLVKIDNRILIDDFTPQYFEDISRTKKTFQEVFLTWGLTK